MTAGFQAQASGLDFAVLTVTGRSFLYHQILSMMGLVLAVAGGLAPAEYITLALCKTITCVVCHFFLPTCLHALSKAVLLASGSSGRTK